LSRWFKRGRGLRVRGMTKKYQAPVELCDILGSSIKPEKYGAVKALKKKRAGEHFNSYGASKRKKPHYNE